jgi:hypothetical protein
MGRTFVRHHAVNLPTWQHQFVYAHLGYETYLEAYEVLIGDRRTRETFRGVVEGIIANESLLAARIARFSPRLARGKHAERRVRRMANEESTKRSQLDAEHLTGVLREVRAAAVGEAELRQYLRQDGDRPDFVQRRTFAVDFRPLGSKRTSTLKGACIAARPPWMGTRLTG